MEATECGAASLAMVLDHWGRQVPLDALRRACGVGRDGSTAAGIGKAAAAEGLEMALHRTSASAAANLPVPLIAFWEHRHFLVVEGRSRRGWYLNDPAKGRYRVDDQTWQRSYSNVALVFTRTESFTRRGSGRPGFLATLLQPIRGSLAPLLLAMVVGVLLIVPGVLLPALASIFVDDVIVADSNQWLGAILIGLALVASYAVVMRVLDMWIMLHLGMSLSARMGGGLLWHLLQLPMEFFAQRPTGGLMTRIGDNEGIAHLLTRGIPKAILGGITMIVMLVAITLRSPLLAGVAVAAAVADLLALVLVSRSRIAASQRLQAGKFALSGKSMEGLREVDAMKAQGAQAQFIGSFMSLQAHNLDSGQHLARVTAYFGTVPGAVSALSSLGLLTVGALLVMNGALTVGGVVACMMLTSRFLRPVGSFLGLGKQLQTAHATLTQVRDVFDNPLDPELTRTDGRQQPLTGQISLRDITFGYSTTAPPVVHDVRLDIPAGSSVAIVGRSGCGKSTLGDLIAGVYQPWSGSVAFDGVPRSELARDCLVAAIAKVNQRPYLFAGTVEENLRLWDPQLPDDALLDALRDACALDFVAARGGLAAPVTEGGRNFSGGQCQRLEIARALSRNPSLLILDEATSALDARTEAKVSAAIRRSGRTVVIIAHRLSAIRDVDAIAVVHGGTVVEHGTRDELVAAGGYFARMTGAT